MTIYNFTLYFVTVIVKAGNKGKLVNLMTYGGNVFGYLVTTSLIPKPP